MKSEITGLFEKWNQALQSGNPDRIVALYAPDAILLPTVSDKIRHSPSEIRDYFEHFMAGKPSGSIVESNIRVFGDIAINSGHYMFEFGSGALVHARFTFVYHKKNNQWSIVEHHSSRMP